MSPPGVEEMTMAEADMQETESIEGWYNVRAVFHEH